MSNNENDTEEAALDLKNARFRRQSVQFIDKSIIRRRSSCVDKQIHFQEHPLTNLNREKTPNNLDYLQSYSENFVLYE